MKKSFNSIYKYTKYEYFPWLAWNIVGIFLFFKEVGEDCVNLPESIQLYRFGLAWVIIIIILIIINTIIILCKMSDNYRKKEIGKIQKKKNTADATNVLANIKELVVKIEELVDDLPPDYTSDTGENMAAKIVDV